jgi:transposase
MSTTQAQHMTFTKYEKRGTKEYAYQLTSYRDKTTKQVKHKKKYLGVVIDKEKQIYQKTNTKTKNEKLILDFGDTYIINTFIQTHYKQLQTIFQEKTPTLTTLITYRLCQTSAMTHANTWYQGSYTQHIHKNINITSQRISEFLTELGDEQLYQTFFKQYLTTQTNQQPTNGVIIDTTSLPTQTHIPLTAWGRSGEEIDKQIRFLLVVNKDNSLPLYFRILPGNIVDVSSLCNTTEELKQYGVKSYFLCVDAGFFSKHNIVDLYNQGISFLTRLPASTSLYRELVETEVKGLESPVNVVRFGKRGLFVLQKKVELFGKVGFAYVVLDPERKGRESKRLILQTVDDDGGEGVKRSGLGYDFLRCGVMVLVSSFEISREEVVPLYYLRQRAEVLFGFAKDDLGFLPLRVHREESVRGFLLLQFLCLIVFAHLKQELGVAFSVEEVLLTMRNLKCKVYEDEVIICEPNREQKDICKKLDIVVPKTLGI